MATPVGRWRGPRRRATAPTVQYHAPHARASALQGIGSVRRLTDQIETRGRRAPRRRCCRAADRARRRAEEEGHGRRALAPYLARRAPVTGIRLTQAGAALAAALLALVPAPRARAAPRSHSRSTRSRPAVPRRLQRSSGRFQGPSPVFPPGARRLGEPAREGPGPAVSRYRVRVPGGWEGKPVAVRRAGVTTGECSCLATRTDAPTQADSCRGAPG
jgi:hypothetical protein